MEFNGRREGIRAVTHADDTQMTIRAGQTAICAMQWRTENGKKETGSKSGASGSGMADGL